MSHATGLRPWTELVRPHDDVASGELSMGTYAANLAAATLGSDGLDVYAKADDFFRATYVTQTMKDVLGGVFGALIGGKGDRVVQLRTPFGGGKTHSLLALYHLATDRDAARVSPELDGLPDPGRVRVAVLSGEWLDSARGREVDGRTIRTLWGELAFQLGGWQAFDELLVDGEEASPPAGERLAALLGDVPNLILADEVLLYIASGKEIRRGDTTAGAQAMRFMQHLTESVNQRPRSALVYSLQASVGEAVGEEGLLAQLEKIHSRIDVRKEPVAGDEVLRVVQRRLFAELPDEPTRREIARAYSAQLHEHLEATAETESDRLEAGRLAVALEDRIVASYPFHPELIDLMHQRWGSLPNYQRTRGALQFLATVVHAVWAARGERAPGALVGPGDVDLTHKDTRANFLEQVGQADQYSSVVEADFLAADAGTRAIDARIGRSGVALERLRVGSRVATVIMLLSFSGKDFGEQRGATEREIVDASLVPGLDAHLVREALAEMQKEALLYLHHSGSRYFFDIIPNVNKLVRSEADAASSDDVLDRVKGELTAAIGADASRHAVLWPATPAQVPDDGGAFRIVYLSPDLASTDLDAFVLDAGGRPRRNRNALGFAIPRGTGFDAARRAARTLLAVDRLLERAEKVKLAPEQKVELRERQTDARRELSAALRGAYETVKLPVGLEDQKVRWDEADLATTLGSGQTLHDRIRDSLSQLVFVTITPSRVRTLGGLDRNEWVWCERLATAAFEVFDAPKLWTIEPLRAAIAKGVTDGVFGYAGEAREEDSKLALPHPSVLRLRVPMSPDQIDLGPGGALVTLAEAARLVPPVSEPATSEQDQSSTSTGNGDGNAGTDSSGADPGSTTSTPSQSRVHLKIDATQDDLHTLQRALAGLRDLVKPGHVKIHIEVDADTGGPEIDKVGFANKVREPLEEDEDVAFTEQWASD